jgi:uncharacterized cupin superfamily protein
MTLFLSFTRNDLQSFMCSVRGLAGIVEHTLEAKSLGAPMHKHTREDEISYLLEGELSVIQNGQIITPGNFQYYFAEMAPFLLPGTATTNG